MLKKNTHNTVLTQSFDKSNCRALIIKWLIEGEIQRDSSPTASKISAAKTKDVFSQNINGVVTRHFNLSVGGGVIIYGAV